MKGDRKAYRPEVGHVRVEYGCGHDFRVNYYTKMHPRAGTKSFVVYGFNIDNTLAECGFCMAKRLEKKGE